MRCGMLRFESEAFRFYPKFCSPRYFSYFFRRLRYDACLCTCAPLPMSGCRTSWIFSGGGQNRGVVGSVRLLIFFSASHCGAHMKAKKKSRNTRSLPCPDLVALLQRVLVAVGFAPSQLQRVRFVQNLDTLTQTNSHIQTQLRVG